MSGVPLSRIEISRGNLIHNIRQFKNLVNKGTRISVAIKSNAYGHGQNIVAKILEPYVDYFQVDDIEELELLRRITQKPTLVLGYVQKKDLPGFIHLRGILSVFTLAQLKNLDKVAGKFGIKQKIHIPIDAYLGREGFLLDELPKVFQVLKKCKNLKLIGLYAHFANLEDTSNFSYAQKQINAYGKAVAKAKTSGFENLQTHISATSGILVYEKALGLNPLVRLGIGVYGMWPSEEIKKLYKNKMILKPVMALKTKVAEIKTLPVGSTIGYGLTYVTKKKTKIALVPLGYSDGIDRGLSNNGSVLIRGKRCNILGRVMMNMFSVNVSHLSKINLEDEVVILGKQGKGEITAEEIAKALSTINYEVTTRMSALLPRITV